MTNKIPLKLPNISSKVCGIADVNVVGSGGPEDGITRFGNAIKYVSTERSRMGAYQNRLEHTITNLDNINENTSAAESRIRDTDIPKEMVTFSMHSILEQSGQSMLAQANTNADSVLSLLQ